MASKDIIPRQPLENDEYIFIEYGAGRAGLSSFVAAHLEEAIKEKSKNKQVKFIIVDRDTRRRKLDKTFRDVFVTCREKMDIADFNLEVFLEEKVEEGVFEGQSTNLVCIAKHLCGGATDLSLTSLLSRQSTFPTSGIAIATCCHHQCDHKTFVNLDYLKTELQFSDHEIEVLPRMSSWAIRQDLDNIERREVGLKVKRILDCARIEFIRDKLKDSNMNVGAVEYCDPLTESPESTLIVAFPS